MVAALLDQRAGDRIGRAVAILRRPHPYALADDFLPDLIGEAVPHQLLGEVGRRRDQHEARECRIRRLTSGDGARQQECHPTAHRRADHDLRPATKLLEHGDALFEPAPDGTVDEDAARFAMAGIIESNTGAAMFRGPNIQRERFCAPHIGIEPAEPEQPGAAAHTGAHGDPAAATALAHLDKGRFLVDCC